MTAGPASIDASVTLEEVLTVVEAKRVPVAAELAGYLVLEVAEGSDPLGPDVDPRGVFVGEEGSVAIVRARPSGAAGGTEASVRNLLARLLEASGSQTPALLAAAKRKPSAGVAQLIAELEAALIPVNRAAGRRALARLAREVKRVTLGVGRNASTAPPTMADAFSRPRKDTRRSDAPRPPGSAPAASPRTEVDEGLAGTAAPPLVVALAELAAPAGGASIPPEGATTKPHSADARLVPAVERLAGGRDADDVDSLLATFEVSGNHGDGEMARELKSLAGLEPTPPPPQAAARHDEGVDALLALSERHEAPAARDGRSSKEPRGGPPHSGEPDSSSARGSATARPPMAPPAPHVIEYADLPSVELSPSIGLAAPAAGPNSDVTARPRGAEAEPAAPRRAAPRATADATTQTRAQSARGHGDAWLLVAAIVALGAGVGALVWLRPSFFGGKTTARAAAERALPEAERERVLLAGRAAACRAALTISDVPTHAEVLLRVGQAPIDVERMPVGTRLEFVAMADAFLPRRAVVLPNATWSQVENGRPRYELGVQLDPVKRGSSADLWPAAEPGSEVGGKGPPGTVRVVASPPGAEVWLLAGVGPEASIDQLPCGQDVDVLLAGPTTFRRRIRVVSKEFTPSEGGMQRVAQLSAKAPR